MLPSGRLAEEHLPASGAIPRVASEEAAASVAEHGVRVSVMRLHWDGSRSTPQLIPDLDRPRYFEIGVERTSGTACLTPTRWFCAIRRR